MRLENKVAIVTGAGRGLGKGIAKKLAKEGAKVVLADMSPADEAVAEIEGEGGTACAFTVNVAKQDEVQALVAFTVEKYGELEIMVNNAGINRDGMLHKMTAENWNTVIDIDLTGTFYGTQEAVKYMRNKNKGRIINISSIVGIHGNAGQVNYSASKAGIIGMTKSLAKELGSRGITVNAVAPGFIETEMTEELPEEIREKMLGSIPLGHFGQSEDVAAAVSFLASEGAAYITGQVLGVDGGMGA